MTWRQLFEAMMQIPEDQRDDTAIIHDKMEDEFHEIKEMGINENDDVLGPGEFYLVIKDEN